jgi:beta-phosphoglucomutase-like phosphatase (HAD superfamily)
MLSAGEVLFAGAAEFIREAAAAVPIAIASGAQRHEIEEILDATGLRSSFRTIVAAGETARGKPSPDPYARAFQLLQQLNGATAANRCVAIEDSRWGLESARGAGLRCVGVTTSYAAPELHGAELIVDGLHTLTLSMLEKLVEGAGPAEAGHYIGPGPAKAGHYTGAGLAEAGHDTGAGPAKAGHDTGAGPAKAGHDDDKARA